VSFGSAEFNTCFINERMGNYFRGNAFEVKLGTLKR
jgi:hypothetical protein